MKLSDEQKKMIVAESAMGSKQRPLAAKYGVSQTTIRRVLKECDADLAQKINEKKEENTRNVLAHMGKKTNDVCALIDMLLLAMANKEKIETTSLNQLAVTLGILIDKFTQIKENTAAEKEEDPLSKALREEAARLNNADQ